MLVLIVIVSFNNVIYAMFCYLVIRLAQSEFRKILRFRVVTEKVHSTQPKRFTRRAARHTASLKSGGGGGGVVAELSTKEKIRRSVQK